MEQNSPQSRNKLRNPKTSNANYKPTQIKKQTCFFCLYINIPSFLLEISILPIQNLQKLVVVNFQEANVSFLSCAIRLHLNFSSRKRSSWCNHKYNIKYIFQQLVDVLLYINLLFIYILKKAIWYINQINTFIVLENFIFILEDTKSVNLSLHT